MSTFTSFIIIIGVWLVYYIIARVFVVNSKLTKYIEKTKTDGNYNETNVDIYKKYLNYNCIISTVMFIVITIVIFALEFAQVNSALLGLVIVLATGKLVLVIGDKIISNKIPFKH